jgi:PAS domain S-box-containing protein
MGDMDHSSGDDLKSDDEGSAGLQALEVERRAQLAAALRESELRLHKLADNLSGAMVYQATVEPDGARRFTYLSRSLERLNELSVEAVLADATLIYRQFLPESAQLVREREEEALKNLTTLRVEVRSLLPSGLLRWFEFTSTPRYLPDSLLVWDGVEVDITERKQVEEELERRVSERTAELTASNQQLQSEIEERNAVQRLLQESEERYRSLYMDSRDANMMVAQDRGFLAANPAAIKLFGCRDEQDFTDHTPASLSPECQPDGARSTDKAQEMMDLALAKGSHFFEWTHCRVDGTEFPATVMLSRFEHRAERLLMATVRDVTVSKQAEKLLRDSEARYRALFDQAVDGIVFLSLDGKSLLVNGAFAKMHGYDSPQEMEHLRLRELDTPETAQLEPERMRRLVDGEAMAFEVEHYRKDGAVFPLHVSSNIIEFGGNQYLLGFYHDITGQKQAEAERRSLEDQMRHTQKLESLGVMAGGIAHDFNNILHIILANAHHSQKVVPEVSAARPFVDNIERAANRAAVLTRQMLAYSGRGRFLCQELDMGELVREITHLVRSSVSKKVTLQTKLSGDLAFIEADAAQIQQVLMNLVLNATEALDEEDGGLVTVSAAALHCTEDYLRGSRALFTPPAGEYVCVEVSDTGCGMGEETVDRLFDPFFTTKFTGRGLGMSAVLGIVRGHRGAIMVDSAVGKGTTVRVLFPASVKAAHAVPEGVPESHAAAAQKAHTILFVDDEPDMLEIGAFMLEDMGYSVVTATGGMEAVEALCVRGGDVDCAVLDLSMPHMDGAQTLLELRRIKPDIRAILTSGYAQEDLEARLAGQKVDAVMTKPYDFSALSLKLREILS